MPSTPSERYAALAAANKLDYDPAQAALASRLSRLATLLQDRRLAAKGSSLGWLFARRQRQESLRGIYVHGGVGRGKTMLVDMFFESVGMKRKRRAHFNDFMADAHDRIHAFRQKLKRGEIAGDDPIAPVAADLAAEARLLCLDELHVDDIADAMILGRLFRALFRKGTVLVATSNAAPDELYAGGLNRDLFLPFVSLLKEHMDVVHLDAAADYRLEKLRTDDVFFAPAEGAARAKMAAAWRRLTGTKHGEAAELAVKGRRVIVPQSHMGVARFTFSQLCEAPLGPNDFIAIARAYHTLLVDDIPLLSEAHRNHVRRFVLLIDTLYDNRVKLIASAAAEPAELYRKGPLIQEFQRTASRLYEMRSGDYLAAPHGARHAGATGAAV